MLSEKVIDYSNVLHLTLFISDIACRSVIETLRFFFFFFKTNPVCLFAIWKSRKVQISLLLSFKFVQVIFFKFHVNFCETFSKTLKPLLFSCFYELTANDFPEDLWKRLPYVQGHIKEWLNATIWLCKQCSLAEAGLDPTPQLYRLKTSSLQQPVQRWQSLHVPNRMAVSCFARDDL